MHIIKFYFLKNIKTNLIFVLHGRHIHLKVFHWASATLTFQLVDKVLTEADCKSAFAFQDDWK